LCPERRRLLKGILKGAQSDDSGRIVPAVDRRQRALLGASGRAALLLLGVAAAAGGDQTVTVGPGLAFSPATVTVAPGETVTWDFQGLHTSTSDAMTGPEVWNSGLLSSGTFSHTFTTPGTHPYYCALHSFPGGTMMNGVVQVKGAGATPTPTGAATPTQTPTTVPATSTPTGTPTPVPTAVVTATPTLAATASPTPLPPATATPLPTSGPGPSVPGIPLLDPAARLLLALALAAVGITVLTLAARR
jgi:plastocyanin